MKENEDVVTRLEPAFSGQNGLNEFCPVYLFLIRK